MNYFDHPYASNSTLKELVNRHNGNVLKPDNIEQIYSFGTDFHAGILEPHKMTLREDIFDLERARINTMRNTFWKDDLCRKIMMAPDFKREHEFYRKERFGIGAKCKCDGISKKLGLILELKGLSVTTEKAFMESIRHLGYDQGATWYLEVTTSPALLIRYKLIVGISKKEPDRMWKVLIDRNHELYKSGLQKVRYSIHLWKNVYGFN